MYIITRSLREDIHWDFVAQYNPFLPETALEIKGFLAALGMTK